MGKIDDMIQRLCPNGVEYFKLDTIAFYPKERINITKDTLYIGVENLLKDQGGADKQIKNANSGTAIKFEKGDILIGNIRPYLKKIWLADSDGGTNGDVILIRIKKYYSELLNSKFFYYILSSNDFFSYLNKHSKGAKMPRGDKRSVLSYEVPFPPIAIQNEIVNTLDQFSLLASELKTKLEAELEARRKQYEYYRDQLLDFGNIANRGGYVSDNQLLTWLNPNSRLFKLVKELCPNGVEWKKLGEVVTSINTGLNPRRFFKLNTEDAQNYYITIREIHNGKIEVNKDTDRINDDALKLCNHRSNLEAGDVLFSGTGTIGETVVVKETPKNWNIKEGVYSIKPLKDVLNSYYLSFLLRSSGIRKIYFSKVVGGIVKSIPMRDLHNIEIPVPPMPVQEEIVRILDRFDKLVNDISEGLPAEIAARQKQYEYYRDRLLNFKRLEA